MREEINPVDLRVPAVILGKTEWTWDVVLAAKEGAMTFKRKVLAVSSLQAAHRALLTLDGSAPVYVQSAKRRGI